MSATGRGPSHDNQSQSALARTILDGTISREMRGTAYAKLTHFGNQR